MLRIPVSRAKPGMVLKTAVMHPQTPGHLLLRPGATLDDPTLEKLRELKIGWLWIDYPPLDFLMRYTNPRILQRHSEVTRAVSEMFDAVAKSAELDFSVYAKSVSLLMEQLLDDRAAAVLVHDVVEGPGPLPARASNVCFLSMAMGIKLESYLIAERSRIPAGRAKKIENLGVGAMLHDIGLSQAPDEVVYRWLNTGKGDDPRWRRHVRDGFDLVRGRIAPTAAAIVLHHHQRLDGSGFPRRRREDGRLEGLDGKQIHVFARIVGLAEAFQRLKGTPPERAGERTNVEALYRLLRAVRAGRFDPIVFKALLTVVPAFSPGGFVTLSDGRRAVVTEWRPADPCRPIVCPVKGPPDPRKRGDADLELDGPIALEQHEGLAITFDEDRPVGEFLFYPQFPGEFDLRLFFEQRARRRMPEADGSDKDSMDDAA